MPLTFESRIINKSLAVIRCKGRVTLGPEAEALEQEVDRQTKVAGSNVYLVKRVVLNLSQVEFLDSAGLGAIVRIFGALRAAGGGLKLCQMPPKIARIIEITNLGTLFPSYASEAEAVEGFSRSEQTGAVDSTSTKIKVVLVDPSKDLLAGLSAFLNRSGYDVTSTRYAGEAMTLARVTKPHLFISGPGMLKIPTNQSTIEAVRNSHPGVQILQLAEDFHAADAGAAGQELLAQIVELTDRPASA